MSKQERVRSQRHVQVGLVAAGGGKCGKRVRWEIWNGGIGRGGERKSEERMGDLEERGRRVGRENRDEVREGGLGGEGLGVVVTHTFSFAIPQLP